MIDCPHVPACGGCPHLGLTAQESLSLKRERVARALRGFASLGAIPVLECRPAPQRSGHRTRVKLPVAVDDGGRVAIGLFALGSHRVLDLPKCRVVAPVLSAVLASLRELLVNLVPPVSHVDLRFSRATGEVLATLVARRADTEQRVRLRSLAEALAARHPEVRGVGLRTNAAGPTPMAIAGKTERLFGDLAIEERLAGRRFRLSPGSFFQADPAAAEVLHDLARGFLAPISPMKTLVDLYAGVGAFGIGLADLAERVIAVESVPEASSDAEASAVLSGVALFVAALPAERFAEELGGLSPDAVIVDPPRRGLDGGTVEAIGRSGAKRIAYASCDPETLARDLASLECFDCVCREVVPADLFALSDEVEALALLERVPGSFAPRVLWRDGDLLAVEKPWILPTKPKAAGAPSLMSLVRRLERDDAWSPVHRLDIGTSGPVLFGRGEELRRMGGAFASGGVREEYLALARGVPRKKGTIATRAPAELGGDEERTRFAREAVVGGYGLVRALPETGKRHQIRRHLARIGHPVLGDERYGDPRVNRWLAERAALHRLFLHLEVLRFEGPRGEAVELYVPLAPELVLVMDRLVALRRR
jgi:23S rRNA (uracil1939-C5)-methyltransferase